VHKVHHHSINPSPWAAFSFHPTEGFIEAGIVPLIVMIMPVHGIAVFIFILFSTLLNVIGHLGYEMYSPGFTKSKFWGFNNTATHHNMHHSFFECNYGLYFNFWDKLMGTNHEKYHETFEKVAGQKAGNASQE
jgi:Delta7-sterol 5-desaturase